MDRPCLGRGGAPVDSRSGTDAGSRSCILSPCAVALRGCSSLQPSRKPAPRGIVQSGILHVKGLSVSRRDAGCGRAAVQGGGAAVGAWPGEQCSAPGLALSRSMERSLWSGGASKLVQLKQLNDTSLVLLPFFFFFLTGECAKT